MLSNWRGTERAAANSFPFATHPPVIQRPVLWGEGSAFVLVREVPMQILRPDTERRASFEKRGVTPLFSVERLVAIFIYMGGPTGPSPLCRNMARKSFTFNESTFLGSRHVSAD